MKHFSLLLCAALLAVATPVSTARAEVDVSIDFFFDALSPHGDWIYADDYGYVFQPALAQQADWAPYSDGYWAYTDAGWTWISNEEFGWATYHYGRWIRMQGSWVWVPGYEWAPAWVSWRQTDDHVGWAPLPPEARWSAGIGFNQWTDSYYDIGPSFYNFVPFNLFARRSSLRPYIVDRRRNITYINRSVNITNISYRQNVVNNIFVGGPDPDRFDRGDNRIPRLSLRRDEDSFRRDWLDNRGDRPRNFSSLSRIERDQLVIASPSIRREESPRLPASVRERFERPEIDRGWRGLSDTKAAENLRARQRVELAKVKPSNLPQRSLQLATGRTPPPAVGRVLRPEERSLSIKRPDPRRSTEEVRRAVPLRPSSEKPGDTRPSIKDSPPKITETRRPESRDSRPGALPMKPGTTSSSKKEPPSTKGRPSLPTVREDRPSESRRPSSADAPPSPSKVRPMPTPETRARTSPMPRPEIPKVKPAPMPKPQAKSQSRPAPESKKPTVQARPAPTIKKPTEKARPAPTIKKPTVQARPSPTIKKPTVKARPSPTVKKPTVQARPKPTVKKAPPKAKPQPRPTAAKRPSSAAKKEDKKRKR